MDVATWNDLPHIDDVSSIDDTDSRCLEEIREVIGRHGKARRFGVTLLHHHFLLSPDETLVEQCDAEKRMLVTSPGKVAEISARDFRPTVWRFDGESMHVCAFCPTHEDDKGNARHDGYKESH